MLLRLDGFEGPLGLLLDLARRQAVNLSRISVLDLADQYLAATEDLGRVGLQRAADWLVMAAWLTWLKSRLLLPRSAREAAQAERAASALTERLVQAERIRVAVAYLEAQPQLGRDAWERSGRVEPLAAELVQPELVSLFRACLAALRRRKREGSYRPRLPPLWRVLDALARLQRLLSAWADEGGADGATLARFLPPVARAPPRYELRCRAAVASTLMAGLELAREGEVTLEQGEAWAPVEVHTRPKPTAAVIGSGPSAPTAA